MTRFHCTYLEEHFPESDHAHLLDPRRGHERNSRRLGRLSLAGRNGTGGVKLLDRLVKHQTLQHHEHSLVDFLRVELSRLAKRANMPAKFTLITVSKLTPHDLSVFKG